MLWFQTNSNHCQTLAVMASYDSILCAEPNSSPHEVSRRFISPKLPQIKKCDVCMDLQFHLEAFKFMMIVSFM